MKWLKYTQETSRLYENLTCGRCGQPTLRYGIMSRHHAHIIKKTHQQHSPTTMKYTTHTTHSRHSWEAARCPRHQRGSALSGFDCSWLLMTLDSLSNVQDERGCVFLCVVVEHVWAQRLCSIRWDQCDIISPPALRWVSHRGWLWGQWVHVTTENVKWSDRFWSRKRRRYHSAELFSLKPTNNTSPWMSCTLCTA